MNTRKWLKEAEQLLTKADWDGPFEGPQGGTYWENTETGEKVYDDPTGEGDDDSTDSDSHDIENANRAELLGAIKETTGERKFDYFRDETTDADDIRDMLDQLPDDEREEIESAIGGAEYHEPVINSSEHIDTVELRDVEPEKQEELASMVDGVIAELDIPSGEVERLHSVKEEGGAMGAAPGSYNYEDNELYLNPDTIRDAGDGSVSFDNDVVPDTVEDIVVHEMMHAAHFAGEGNPEYEEHLSDEEREYLADAVSEYAASNPLEAVAEIGTMHAKGEEVEDRMWDIYEKYGGPDQ